MTFETFVATFDTNLPLNWRRGQALFNRLHETRPDLADQIRGSRIDPFHRDARIPDALDWISLHWDDLRAPESTPSPEGK